jgi:hypothetical protein
MAWYDDERKENYTHTYENGELADQDAHRAEAKGWQVQRRNGRRLNYATLRATFDTVIYQRGEVELAFTRTEEWLAQHRKV